MLRGSLVSLQVKRFGSGNNLDPEVELCDPCGKPLSLGQYLALRPGSAQVRNFPLPDTGEPYETGNYKAVVTSGNGQPGDYRLTWSGRPPKLTAANLEQALLLGVSPTRVTPGAQLKLKVAGADDALANNVVVLNGAPVAIDEGTLRSGRGSLIVTLPAATPAGTSTVQFLCDDEKSNEVSFEVGP
jgi:hypothetical protein